MRSKLFLVLCLLCVFSGMQILSVNKAYSLEENTDKIKYICPMHPEIRQDGPGRCPKCGMNLIQEVQKGSDNNTPLQSIDPRLKTSYVCMMNNKYFGSEQIPVEVEGKTYYGCCQGCVNSLKNNRAIRYSVDPYSGEEVCKADAYIVLNSDSSQNVLYFKSAENYGNYLIKKPIEEKK